MISAPLGIHAIPLPTMLPIGLVNVYVIDGDPLTLIDAGPKTDDAYDALRHGLKDVGHSIEDIDQILLTHGHVDHAGLAETVRRDSNAKILVPEQDRAMVEKFSETFASRRARFCNVLLSSGAPPETCDLVAEFFDWVRGFGEPAAVGGDVRDGETLPAGQIELRAVHTPGHTAGSTCYLTADLAIFSGDTLIRDITPNAAFGGADGISVGLADHVASISRLKGMPVAEILPGHRERFANLRAYVEEYMQRFHARQAALLRLLRSGPRTPFELMVDTFGTLPIQEIFLGVTEVLGHLEVLVLEGAVVADEKAGRLVYGIRPR